MTHKILQTTKLDTPLPIEDLTEVKLDGTGVLDRLLQNQRLLLDREFGLQRIVGKEYSDAFIKTYAPTLEIAIRFLLEKEKQSYEISLVESQIAKAEADTAIANKELELKVAMMPHQVALIKSQAEKMEADTNIALKDLELKTALLPHQIALTKAQSEKMQADVLIANKQLEIMDKELLLKAKELEIAQQNLALINQKVITEKAQTDPEVIKPNSVIATNIDTLKAQIKGMERDAQQKLANMMLTTWVARVNNDGALNNTENKLTDSYIGQAVTEAFNGMGLTI